MVYCATSGFAVEETEASAEGSNEYREPHPIEVSKRTAIEHANTICDRVKAWGAPFLKMEVVNPLWLIGTGVSINER
jgi:hypothetical protein